MGIIRLLFMYNYDMKGIKDYDYADKAYQRRERIFEMQFTTETVLDCFYIYCHSSTVCAF